MIISSQAVFLKLKKLGAIKLFITKLQKYDDEDYDDLPDVDKNNKNDIEKIIFNCRVALFLMCQEAKSQQQIFKLKGMEHIVALLKHTPSKISDQLRFSKILLNFSLETPNSRIGSTFSAFVEPFFYLLSLVIKKELNLYLYNKDLFYKDILRPSSEDLEEKTPKDKDDTTSHYSASTKQVKDMNMSFSGHPSKPDRKKEQFRK